MYDQYVRDYKPMSAWEIAQRTFLDIEALSCALSFAGLYYDTGLMMMFFTAKTVLT